MGLERTTKRRKQHQKELRAAAQQTRNIRSIFQQQLDQRIPVLKTVVEVREKPTTGGTHWVIRHRENLKLARQKASLDLNRLLRLKTKQKKKYRCTLSSKPNLLRRHLLVQAFFNL